MLNVYKCSGVGRVDEVADSKYQYYTGQTNEATNTVAFNYLLASINSRIAEYPYHPENEQIDLLNVIDVIAVSLEGLALLREHPDKYDVTLIGNVVSSMIAAGKFDADFIEDNRRADNLEQLVAEFTDLLVNGTVQGTDDEFNAWWNENILPYNYNEVTNSQLTRYNEIITDNNKVGSDNDAKTLSQYICDAGPGFLYMFIPEEDVKKYNTAIRLKRKIEIEKSFDFIRKNTYGMLNDAAIKEQLRTGIWIEYHMSPEDKLKQILSKGGKVGEFFTVLAAISGILSILAMLFGIIMEIFKLTYTVPDGYEDGVPSEEDLNEMLADSDTNEPKNNKWLWLGGLGLLGGLLLLN